MSGWWLALVWIGTAWGAPIDDYAARPGWACTFGVDSVSCGGPAELAGVPCQQTVELCGEGGELCETAWSLSAAQSEVDAAAATWAQAAQRTLGEQSWQELPRGSAGTWLGALRNSRSLAVLELGDSYVKLSLAPRASCRPREVAPALDSLLAPLAGSPRQEPWSVVEDVRIDGGFSEAEVARAHARRDVGMVPEDLARHRLLADETFVCYKESRRFKTEMGAIRAVYEDWEEWRSPDPKVQRQRERALRKMEREAGPDRDIAETALQDVPDEQVPEPPPGDGGDSDEVLDEVFDEL